MFDLHTHTRHSDGLTSPTDNAAMAAAAGMAGVALTDHDTFAGWEEMAVACRVHGVEFVPGVELSSEEEGRSVHILGYWVDPGHPGLAAECRRLSAERLLRAEAILGRLGELGIDVPLADVLRRAGDAPVTRPHIAEALVDHGAVADVPAAFEMFLGDDGAAYVPKHALAPEAAVTLIRAAGGAAVLAHPAVDRGAAGAVGVPLLERLVAAGLAGVEADHPGHDDEQVTRWRLLARDHDLLVTGSSDFHGRYDDERIGRCTTPSEVVHRLAMRAGASAVATEGT
jgi:3',5'-nucleoside bisphosphate phosphatase